MQSLICIPFALAALLALVGPVAAQSIVTYEADYAIEYKGREAGTSRFSVRAESDPGTYRFVSDLNLKGLIARLVAPNAVVENSVFRLAAAGIEPIEFRYRDGSRKGEDNYAVEFRWPATASLITGDERRKIDLVAGTLDRGSAQVALMRDAAAGSLPATYRIIDDDGLESYAVTALEPASTTTAAGEFRTVRYAQQRIGSSRRTVFWLAPALQHLPVRIERIRDGEAETVFALTAVEFTGR